MPTLGIDVSHWQGRVNWQTVAGSDAKFAIAKATEGTSSDDQFKDNWSGIQEAGLFRGAYHFARPGTDAETQAVHFASVVGPLGFRDLPPTLDLEQADGKAAAAILDWAKAFILKAEALFGRQLMVYTGQFWRGTLADPAEDDFFSKRALWLAGYVRQQSLKVPKTWAKNSWTFWQYSDGKLNGPAKIPGVAPCDQSWFKGEIADLDVLCQGQPSPQPPAADGGQDEKWPGTFFIWPRTPAVSGSAVKAWQARMIQRQFPIDADGVYGPQSRNACLAFQRNQGLVRDGIVGQATWNATFAADTSEST
jgi:lysozyme